MVRIAIAISAAALLLARAVSAAAPPLVAPESAGFVAPRLQRLDAYMHGLVDRGERAGIVTVVARGGHIVQLGEYGLSDLAGRRPMRADTLVRIHSMTEPVTAVAVMILYEEGRLQLSDAAADYLPELAKAQVLQRERNGRYKKVAAASPITIGELLAQTAGLAYAYPAAAHLKRPSESVRESLEERVHALARLPLVHEPGAGFTPCPCADVLARLVEVVSQQPFDQFLEQRIFQPLNMSDTGFRVPPEKRDRLAEVYATGAGGGLALATRAAPRGGPYEGQGRLMSGAEGLVSTALDYWTFAQMLASGGELDGVRILSPATVELMFRDQLRRDSESPSFITPAGTEGFPGHGFGLGFAVLTHPESYGAAATPGLVRWGGLLGTMFFIDPDKQIVAVLVSQQLQRSPDRLARAFQALVYQALAE